MKEADVEQRLVELGKARSELKRLNAEREAAVALVEEAYNARIVAAKVAVETTEEMIDDWAMATYVEGGKYTCTAGRVVVSKGKPKVDYEKGDEEAIIAHLQVIAPALVYNKVMVNKAAIIAANRADDKGMITLANLANVAVIQELSVKITC
jgi:phage host-nuclease inhibitor protein Gam